MKRIVLSLSVLGLVVLGLAGIVPSLPPQVGVQTAVQADTETTITLDVAPTAARSTTLREFRWIRSCGATASSSTGRYFVPALFPPEPRATIQMLPAASAPR